MMEIHEEIIIRRLSELEEEMKLNDETCTNATPGLWNQLPDINNTRLKLKRDLLREILSEGLAVRLAIGLATEEKGDIDA